MAAVDGHVRRQVQRRTDSWWRRPQWRRGRIVAALAVAATLPLLLHRFVPNTPGHLGSLLETFLPWWGLVTVPPLLVAAAVRRSWTAALAACLPAAVWLAMFGAFLLPDRGPGGPHDLRVVTHNVNASNPDPAATARDLLRAHADVVALEELPPGAAARYGAVLDAVYPYRASQGTVAVWSRCPLGATEPVDVGMGFTRALRTDLRTPKGDVALYVAHLASVRVGGDGFTAAERDATVRRLAQQVRTDPARHVVVLGDFNGTTDDRGLRPLTGELRDVQRAAGSGFGFTWPSQFPMAAIDHVLVRGVVPVAASVLGATPSDHRPLQADLRW